MQQGQKGSVTPALDQYSRDLTQMAAEGRLDPVVGRDREITRLIQILSRRTKNNPCLVGEPGVGKTAIAEGLAQRIIAGHRAGYHPGQKTGCAGSFRNGGWKQIQRRVRGANPQGGR